MTSKTVLKAGEKMEEKNFVLMHRNDPVCSVTIDLSTGVMMKVSKAVNPELLPPGGCIDAEMLRKWWYRRAVPIRQGNIRTILDQLGITTSQEYLVKNLGLSLSDHYWIRPLDVELDWNQINLYTNDFKESVGNMQIRDSKTEVLEVSEHDFSPSSSTQGELRKKWVILDGKRYLIKGNHGSNAQESLNEVLAAVLHEKQGLQPYVTYQSIKVDKEPSLCCICQCFTTDQIEFIPAIDLVNSKKKNNSVSVYEHFIGICHEQGLDQNVTRAFLEYQILTDFILTNIDRHLNNFGVLRHTDSLKIIAMAPIFDSGNAMFWNNPRLPSYDDLRNIEVNSFRNTESQLLKYVQDREQVDLSKLPPEEEIRKIYSLDALIPCVDVILEGYRKKIDLLHEWK